MPDIGDNYRNNNVNGKVVNIDILAQKIYVEDDKGNINEVKLNGNS